MKDPDEIKADRITTQLTDEVGTQYRAIAKRLRIPVAELLRLVLEDELQRLESVTHITNLRRRA